MDEKELNERNRLYERTKDELVFSQRSNSENFDKSILTLSSAGIGITVSFLSNIINISEASVIFFLYLSWFLFCAAITSTILSFLNSQRGIKLQLEYAEKYYLDGEEEYLKKDNKFSKRVEKLNNWSARSFISAIIFLIIFVIINITIGANKVSNNEAKKPTILNEGNEINKLQKVVKPNIEKGQTINPLQPLKKPDTSSTSTNKPNSSDSKTTNDKK